jgi:hypothetical protein
MLQTRGSRQAIDIAEAKRSFALGPARVETSAVRTSATRILLDSLSAK